ncbi:MAG UNVERIFIED_CONTAM: GNAT family N-acetyltransferase [Rickettsiaceae bacterium]
MATANAGALEQLGLKYAKNFMIKKEEYHSLFGVPRISVDWDEYVGDKADPDRTANIAHIETANISMRNITPRDLDKAYPILWGNEGVMKLFGYGKPNAREEIQERIGIWDTRWHKKDPCSGFVIEDKTGEQILGNLVLGHSENKNTAEFAIMLAQSAQGKKIGSESSGALVFDWSSYIVDNGWTFNDGQHLHNIFATAHVDNGPSNHLIQKSGFQLFGTQQAHGAMRNHYNLNVVEPLGEDTISSE